MDKYGASFPSHFTEAEIEAWCFLNKRSAEKGGLGQYRHFKNLSRMLWPKMEWHDWSRDSIQALCEHSTNAWTGCAAAGKTHTIGHFAMPWWAVDPSNSVVILTSTTGKMVRKRIWPVIQELYHSAEKIKHSPLFAEGFIGNLVDSKTTLQAKKGDDKHGIFAIAVRDGPTSKAVADIQGLHAERMMLVIDEATDTPEAIFEAVTNLRKGCQEFKIVVIGNPVSHMDPHGVCCEPKKGWNSITIEDTEWETAGVAKWEIDPGICLHFDGLKSPNLKPGSKKLSFLISAEDIERARKTDIGEESVGFWKFTRGFWPPDGVCNTVLSESMIENYKCRERHVWYQSKEMIAALDSAFGGDSCVLKFGWLGDLDATGKKGIEIAETIPILPKARSPVPADHQIAREAIAHCKSRGVTPDRFGLDATGTGRGVAAIMSEEWGVGIHKVEFGGAPSKKPASADDPRPSIEVYDRRVTELWYQMREFVLGGQLKGLNNEDCKELCAREYSQFNRKIVLDPKEKCREKIGRSPDNADCISVLVEVARNRGASAGTSQSSVVNQEIRKVAQSFDSMYDTDDESNPQVPVTEDHYGLAFSQSW